MGAHEATALLWDLGSMLSSIDLWTGEEDSNHSVAFYCMSFGGTTYIFTLLEMLLLCC
jgi:hypothetical protein